jgi:enamine deaminase RidA (YjgF/YER057c/UK114 family)
MPRRLISSGSTFEKIAGYSRAVVDGDFCFVSGTTGYDYAKMAISPDVAAQTEQCFANIRKARAEAGFALEDAVRVVIHLGHAGDFEKAAAIVGKHLKHIRPANTTVVSQLLSPDMKIEIEVTAKKRSA